MVGGTISSTGKCSDASSPVCLPSTFTGEFAVFTHRLREVSLENVFALIEGHPAQNGKHCPKIRLKANFRLDSRYQ